MDKEKPIWWSVVLPATLAALAALAVVVLTGCEQRGGYRDKQVEWHGLDRPSTLCVYDGDGYHTSCVGDGRMHRCVSNDGWIWQCAEMPTVASSARCLVEKPTNGSTP